MAQIRVKIDQTIIDKAFEGARSGVAGRDIYADTEQRSLALIRRGGDLGWYVKTRDFTRRLGDVAKSYKSKDALPPRAAREAAARLLAELRTSPKEQEGTAPTRVWSWADCVTARLLLLSGNRVVARRIKIPLDRNTVRRSSGIRHRSKDGHLQCIETAIACCSSEYPPHSPEHSCTRLRHASNQCVRPREKFLA